MTVRYHHITDTGHVRASNQDRVLADADHGLWAVADGMGGHAGGAEASRIACESLSESIGHGMPLTDAFEVAHARVRAVQEDQPALRDMGTTLVAVHERNGGFELAWVGDSRVYRLDGSGAFSCLTRDQNVAGRLLDSGHITEAQAREHPHRHVLTDCIGQRQGLPTVDSTRVNWHAGDRLLLCSDGLNGELSDERIAGAMAAADTPREAADALVEAALQAGGRDNISLIVLDAP
jgi:protein phosphatase